MVDKAERKTSILPSDDDTYIATIVGAPGRESIRLPPTQLV